MPKIKPKNSKDIEFFQELVRITDIKDKSIACDNQKKYYMRTNPKNINILMKNELLGLVLNLKKVINMADSFEICVVDKTERIEDNKNYIQQLIDKKENFLFKDLLQQDLENLNKTFSKGASREFYFIIPYKDEKEKETIQQLERTIENQSFDVVPTKKTDLKNMLQVYFERNFTNIVVTDYDNNL